MMNEVYSPFAQSIGLFAIAANKIERTSVRSSRPAYVNGLRSLMLDGGKYLSNGVSFRLPATVPNLFHP